MLDFNQLGLILNMCGTLMLVFYVLREDIRNSWSAAIHNLAHFKQRPEIIHSKTQIDNEKEKHLRNTLLAGCSAILIVFGVIETLYDIPRWVTVTSLGIVLTPFVLLLAGYFIFSKNEWLGKKLVWLGDYLGYFWIKHGYRVSSMIVFLLSVPVKASYWLALQYGEKKIKNREIQFLGFMLLITGSLLQISSTI